MTKTTKNIRKPLPKELCMGGCVTVTGLVECPACKTADWKSVGFTWGWVPDRFNPGCDTEGTFETRADALSHAFEQAAVEAKESFQREHPGCVGELNVETQLHEDRYYQ